MKTEPAVLLTGFEPFGGERINPAQEIVRALDGEIIAAHRVVGAILPVAFAATLPMLEDLLDSHRPTLVLALGQAGGRSEISLERVAINLIDARIADNDGLQPIDEEVIANAPGAYFSTLPVKAIEQVFYGLAHLLATRHPAARGGFVHVPWLPEQAARRGGQPSMALATMIDGVRAAIECSIATPRDLHVVGGAIA